jgi:hypothetical protein
MKPGGFVLGASIASAVAFVGACALAVIQFSILLEAAAR